MGVNVKGGSLVSSVMVVYFIVNDVLADFEVCNPGTSDTVYQFIFDNCPSGVLFDHPISVNCLASTNFPEHFLTDLCAPSRNTLNVNDRPYQIHLAFQMDPEPVDSEGSCFGIGPEKCDVPTVTPATNDTLTPPVGTGCDSGYDPVTTLTPEEEAKRKDPRVFNQTERLFKYMLGLIDDEDKAEGHTLRLVKLLKSCFKIFKKFSNKFIRPEFGKDVLKAFLFLFRDSDLTNFKDISVEDFQIISKTLIACESMTPPFNLIGRNCRTCANVYSIEKMGKTLRYKENEFEFVWGKHDVPTDAAWNIVTFVHGLCYGTYRLHVNYHHMYEQEMERLFTPEILYRWSRPPLLYHEDLWDHIFSTPVKNAMKNLDVSIFGAYHNSPFLHRLERPIKQPDTTATKAGKRRKKRSLLPTMSLDDGGLKGAGWCFQNEDELIATVSAYINYHCPSVPVPQEIERMMLPGASDPDTEPLKDESDSGEFMLGTKNLK